MLQPILRNLTADDRPKPTPCTEFTCHELAEHLFGSLTELGAMAGATVVNPEEGSLENRVSVMAGQVIDAWRTVDLDGTVPGPGGSEMPAVVRGRHPADRAACCTAGTWPRPAASSCTSPTSSSTTCAASPRRSCPAVAGAARSPTRSPRPTDATAVDRLAAYAGRTPIAA